MKFSQVITPIWAERLSLTLTLPTISNPNRLNLAHLSTDEGCAGYGWLLAQQSGIISVHQEVREKLHLWTNIYVVKQRVYI